MDVIRSLCGKFLTENVNDIVENYGNGLINDTHLVSCDSGKKYILQKINTKVFKDPVAVMANLNVVLNRWKSNSLEKLVSVKTLNGKNMWDNTWRMFEFMEGTYCLENVKNVDEARQIARAFGAFHTALEEGFLSYPIHSLIEILPDFHNTKLRFLALETAIENEENPERNREASPEIALLQSYQSRISAIVDGLTDGSIPWRVTHNDAKPSNVLLSITSHHAISVIDLDTCMPGSILYDIGDLIRTCCTMAKEDEISLENVVFSVDMYEAIVKGFLEGCQGMKLTERELELIPLAGFIITAEQAARFLTDYISNDQYYCCTYATQNLVRTRVQLELAKQMNMHMSTLEDIVKNLIL
jgi:N-acetylhexosamine 1-kinase